MQDIDEMTPIGALTDFEYDLYLLEHYAVDEQGNEIMLNLKDCSKCKTGCRD